MLTLAEASSDANISERVAFLKKAIASAQQCVIIADGSRAHGMAVEKQADLTFKLEVGSQLLAHLARQNYMQTYWVSS
jgi:hypothetical protein